VSAGAEMIAGLLGFPDNEVRDIRIAANLHDLGKLVVPNAILEKPGPLSKEEFGIIKCHTYYSYHIVASVKGLERLAEWGAFHHEKLTGDGYPFRLQAEELGLCSRVMAVADIFTALAEDRPYRRGMPKDEITRILREQGRAGALDEHIVSVVLREYDRISDHVLNTERLIKSFYTGRFAAAGPEAGG
jgi:HD-GYP domain-containing protein (c-di-GMP phosphodiesterase class II)